jgi:hypothetical protein
MATLPNYLIGGGTPAANPFQSALTEGMRFGATMQNFQDAQIKRQLTAAKLQSEQQEIAGNLARQQKNIAVQERLSKIPSDKWTNIDAIEYMTLFDKDTQSNAKAIFEQLPKEGQKQQVKTLGGIASAIRGGNVDVAKQIMQQQIEANKEVDPAEAQQYQTLLQTLEKNPDAVFPSMVQLLGFSGEEGQKALTSILGAEKTMGEIEGQKTKDLPPSIAETIGFQNLTPAQKDLFVNIQKLKKPPAAVTNIKISDLEGGSQKELAKLVPDLYDRANSAVSQLNELPRYRASLDKAIVGPLAEQRLNVAKVANVLGFTGENSINATREVIQGLSEMALQSRSMLTGQGQITENEQKLLIKARSGDINFNKGELNTIFNVAERASKAQYDKTTKLLKSAAGKSPTAAMFLENVLQLPTQTTPEKPSGMPAGFKVVR